MGHQEVVASKTVENSGGQGTTETQYQMGLASLLLLDVGLQSEAHRRLSEEGLSIMAQA